MNHAQRMLNFASANIDGSISEKDLMRVARETAEAFRTVVRMAMQIKKPLFVGEGEHMNTGAVYFFRDDSVAVFGLIGTDKLLVMEVPIADMPLDVRLEFIKAICDACDVPLAGVVKSALQQLEARALRARDDGSNTMTRPPGA